MKAKEKELREIIEKLYSLNAQISLMWIGMKKTPKEEEIRLLNRVLGETIKQLREMVEKSNTT